MHTRTSTYAHTHDTRSRKQTSNTRSHTQHTHDMHGRTRHEHANATHKQTSCTRSHAQNSYRRPWPRALAPRCDAAQIARRASPKHAQRYSTIADMESLDVCAWLCAHAVNAILHALRPSVIVDVNACICVSTSAASGEVGCAHGVFVRTRVRVCGLWCMNAVKVYFCVCTLNVCMLYTLRSPMLSPISNTKTLPCVCAHASVLCI